MALNIRAGPKPGKALEKQRHTAGLDFQVSAVLTVSTADKKQKAGRGRGATPHGGVALVDQRHHLSAGSGTGRCALGCFRFAPTNMGGQGADVGALTLTASSSAAAAETDQIEVVLGGEVAAVAAVGAGVIDVVKPGPPPHHGPAALGVVPAFGPLPDIADQIVYAFGGAAAGKGAAGCRSLPALPLIVGGKGGVAAIGLKLGTVAVAKVPWAPAGLFPFVLGAQALAAGLAQGTGLPQGDVGKGEDTGLVGVLVHVDGKGGKLHHDGVGGVRHLGHGGQGQGY